MRDPELEKQALIYIAATIIIVFLFFLYAIQG